jgi:subtilisin family serine protease
MTAKKRYVLHVPGHVRHSMRVSLDDVVAGLPQEQLKRVGKAGTRVFELSDAEVAALAKAYPGLLIEEDQELRLMMPMPGLGFQIGGGQAKEQVFLVADAQTEKPIAGATVFVQCEHGTYRADTGLDGQATVTIYETAIVRVIVSPAAQYWSRVVAPPLADGITTVQLTPLTPDGADAWGRKWVGLDAEFPFRGKGIKVAVIDSGIAQHPDLVVAGGFNTLDGEDTQDFQRDEKGHGTHCAGIIAGRTAAAGVLGIAPDAELYSVKAFPGGRLSDLLEGLQWAIDNGIDVVNLSLGMPAPSAQLALKLADVAQQGIVLVAAAGNDGSNSLSHPAADEGVLAVSAFGSTQGFPPDSAHALRVGEMHNPGTGLFVASFSNSGPETAFIAPGVAVISSVPGGYAAWDGTSMACPFVTGLAALLLSAHPELKVRDLRRLAAVRQLLAASAVDLALPVAIQGAGVPQADAALADALESHYSAEQLAAAQQESLRLLEPLIADLEQKQLEIKSMLVQLE